MKTTDFEYNLPQELIAQEQKKPRDHSRLMVLDRFSRKIYHRHFYDIIDYLYDGDLMVLNNTKVFPARLCGRKKITNGKVELLLLNKIDNNSWEALVNPSKRINQNSKIIFENSKLCAKSIKKIDRERHIIVFDGIDDIDLEINKIGQIPFPPYIRKRGKEEQYQTVFAKNTGASAAPTAGLHFTGKLIKKIKDKGIKVEYITLHTGYGTFQPIRTDDIKDHKMHSEYFKIPEKTFKSIKDAKRIIAVGTTTVRALESDKNLKQTNLYIYPGYKFKHVDAMITNFHLPKSSLLVLVSAFAGRDIIISAYEEAIKNEYRFFSFGDAMLIL